jgi:hypothetical protein
MIHAVRLLSALMLLLVSALASTAKEPPSGPQAAGRTNAQNFRDMVLATCIANAYRKDGGAATDAGSSVSALRDWTRYDLERAPDVIKQLVDQYLARDYRNPLAESEVKGVRFDLLKCMDLYHSSELKEQVRRLVMKPNQNSR